MEYFSDFQFFCVYFLASCNLPTVVFGNKLLSSVFLKFYLRLSRGSVSSSSDLTATCSFSPYHNFVDMQRIPFCFYGTYLLICKPIFFFQAFAFVPLMYMCVCTYYSLFKFGTLMFYSLTPRQTSSVNLLLICS